MLKKTKVGRNSINKTKENGNYKPNRRKNRRFQKGSSHCSGEFYGDC